MQECGRCVTHEEHVLLKVVHQNGTAYPIIPDEAALKVPVDDIMRKRLLELRVSYPGPPLAKRARVLAAGSGGPDNELPTKGSLADLLKVAVIKWRGTLDIGGTTWTILWVEQKEQPTMTMHYVQNQSNSRAILKKNQQFSSSHPGEYLDKLVPADVSKLRANALQCPWKLTTKTMLVFQFGDQPEVIGAFDQMVSKARTAANSPELNIYGHTLAESAVPGSIRGRQAVPHARKSADLVVQIEPETQWSTDMLATSFFADAVVNQGGLLRPAYRVKLAQARLACHATVTGHFAHV